MASTRWRCVHDGYDADGSVPYESVEEFEAMVLECHDLGEISEIGGFELLEYQPADRDDWCWGLLNGVDWTLVLEPWADRAESA